jgi:hypothetical protein
MEGWRTVIKGLRRPIRGCRRRPIRGCRRLGQWVKTWWLGKWKLLMLRHHHLGRRTQDREMRAKDKEVRIPGRGGEVAVEV